MMSAYGTLQTSTPTMSMSASGGKADIPDPLEAVEVWRRSGSDAPQKRRKAEVQAVMSGRS